MYSIDQEEIEAVSNVLRSKKLFRYQGKNVETECSKFENEFSQYLKTNHTVLVSSGTNALVAALFSLGIKSGDEVLVPAYTFFATVAAVIEIGATPVLVNINENFEIDFTEAQKKLSSRTKAIIAVHMDGVSCDMNAYVEFKQKNNLLLIEDCAQSVGGEFNGKKLGSFGEAGCFSFNVDKIITCGEGGAVTFQSKNLYQRALMFHDTCNQFGPTLKDSYEIEPFVGKSMRVSEIQGAMIRIQLKKLDKIIQNLKTKQIDLKDMLNLDYLKFNDECGSTIKILLDDITLVKEESVKLQKLGLKAAPLMFRPGHNLNHWNKILHFNKAEYLKTIEILSRTIIIFI